MACGNANKNPCAKSCVRYYNNNAQTLGLGDTIQIIVAGSKVVDSGTAIDVQPQSYTTNKTGLYHVTGDVVINATATGEVALQVYLDGVALPCTLKTVTVAEGFNEIHTETDLAFSACCACVSHNITYSLTSLATATGTVTEVCTGVLKIA